MRTDRQADRQADRHTFIQTDRRTDGQIMTKLIVTFRSFVRTRQRKGE